MREGGPMRFSAVLRHAAILIGSAVLAWSQVGTATINGSVTDPSGAAVASVEVTVVNLDTNFTFTVLTNTEGLYRVPSLQPGPYRLTFRSAGFKQLVRDGVALRTGDVLPVDAKLEVGGLTESIAVNATATLIET